MTALLARSEDHARELIAKLIQDCAQGLGDREEEALTLARLWALDESWVTEGFAEARELAKLVDPAFFSTAAQPQAEEKAEEQSGAGAGAAEEKLAALGIKFHPSDRIDPKAPLTIEERNRAFEEMAELWNSDPLAYAEKRHELAARLCVTVVAVDRVVKIVRDRQGPDEGEQSQATKLTAIGLGEDVRLWHSSGEAYASVRVGEGLYAGPHWENYRLEGTSFEEWLLCEYGRRHQVKNGNEWVPLSPAPGAVKAALGQLKGIAKFKREERQPAIRVGGNREVIWIDLGSADWSAVRVTAGGWEIVAEPGVAFIRDGGKMLPLPEPVRGGKVQPLQKVINVREEDFVLVAGWSLQALNPVGPYPEMNFCGTSEEGKSTVARFVRQTVDPNKLPLRRPGRKMEDLLITAKNGWVLCFDNMSWMSGDLSDLLCMLSTGIATGTRAHYTNDEEHAFEVERPVLFNGIAENLIDKPDLASRTIKLQIPKLAVRRSEFELEEEFEAIWPGVFGALLDGLVAGLRDGPGIIVANPARLKDFEQFAEAGCRAMGFGEGKFVAAYAANREGSMIAAAEASPVGRAVLKLMNSKDGANGWEGSMTELLSKLERFRGNTGWRDWPRDATRLSTDLSRIEKPLAALGITCKRHVDRRGAGGSQRDVVLSWTSGPSAKRTPLNTWNTSNSNKNLSEERKVERITNVVRIYRRSLVIR